jgi:hypothetical protein
MEALQAQVLIACWLLSYIQFVLLEVISLLEVVVIVIVTDVSKFAFC